MVRAAQSASGSAVLEAETMSIASDADTFVFSDAAASGGKALMFPSNDTVNGSITTSASTATLTLRARGDQCQGAPQAQVGIDGTNRLTATVSATSWTNYSAAVNIPAGNHTVTITFPNDRFVRGTCDRNLRVDKLTFVYGTGTGDTTPPAAPTGLAATAGNATASLTWNANGESDLAGYNVYRSTASGGPYTKLNSSLLSTRSYSDSGLTNGTTYFYVIKAQDTSGNVSGASAQAQATPTAPSGTPVASFEAETMTIPADAGAFRYTDSTASGGKGLWMPSNDTVTETVTTPSASMVTVRAKGDQCNGAPNMLVQVDGRTAISVGVAATSFTDYAGAIDLAAGSHTFAITFGNDLYQAGVCDRNLKLDKVTLSGSAGPATQLLPDLVQQPPTQLGVVQSSASWRLGFNSAVENHGSGPLIVDGHRPDTSSPMVADQVVNMSDGTQQTFAAIGSMIFYTPHNHWHYVGFDKYELRNASDYSFVAPDQKSGFCLGDRYTPNPDGTRNEPPPVNGPYTFDNCQPGNTTALNVGEGMSVGYGDDYSPQLEGQYIDVTGVAPGQYVVVHRVNSDQSVHESDYSNDAASVLINLWPNGYGVSPYLQVLATCPTSDHCSQATLSRTGGRPAYRPTHPSIKPHLDRALVDAPLLVPRSARYFALQALHRSVKGRAVRIRCLRLGRAKFNCPITAHVGGRSYRGRVRIWLPSRDSQHWWSYRLHLTAPGQRTLSRYGARVDVVARHEQR
jgi:predicted xylan-binding protein with Ca-dependent carbohydrate-binding module/lysyl oxidase/fibronectin type III domain protein